MQLQKEMKTHHPENIFREESCHDFLNNNKSQVADHIPKKYSPKPQPGDANSNHLQVNLQKSKSCMSLKVLSLTAVFGVLFVEKPRHGGDTGRNDTCVGWVWKFWKMWSS